MLHFMFMSSIKIEMIKNATIYNDVSILANFKYYKPPSQGGSQSTEYCILTYNSNGGTEFKDERYKKNSVVTLPRPTRECWEFSYWHEEGIPDIWYIDTITITRDITLVAEYFRSSEI